MPPCGRYDEAEHLLMSAAAVLKDIPGQQGRDAKATRGRLADLYKAAPGLHKAAAPRLVAPAS